MIASERAAITLAIAGFQDAYNAGDVAAIGSYYSDDLVKLRQDAPPETKAQVIERITEAFRDFAGRLEVNNDEIEVSGELAFTRGRLVVTLTPKQGGEPRVLRRRYLEIWRKEEGQWRVCRTMDNKGAE